MIETFPDYFGKPEDGYSSGTQFGVTVVGDGYSYNTKSKIASDNFMQASVEFLFDSQQMAAFRSWHKYKASNGNAWFWMEIPELGQNRRCRIIEGVFESKLEGYNCFRVSFIVEYRKKKVPYFLTPDDTDEIEGDVSFSGSLVTAVQSDETQDISGDVDFSGSLVTSTESDDTQDIIGSVTFSGSLV